MAADLPGVERLVRSASGQLVAYTAENGVRSAVLVDPKTGAASGAYAPSAFFSFITDLHRSFMLGNVGHGAAGVAALIILALAISGTLLLVGKMGGWRKLLTASRGTGSQRLHTDLARIGVAVLLLTSMTGAYMSAVNFALLPENVGAMFVFPPASAGDSVAPIASLEALAAIPLTDLRELTFPAAGDAADVFTVTTQAGKGFVDQGTGAMLSFTPNDAWQRAYEFIYLLHTGQGALLVALLVGLGALSVQLLAVTGTIIWWMRRRNTPRIAGNVSWRDADTVILVGSEGGGSWGFAAWGKGLGARLGLPLVLNYVATRPATRKLVLVERTLHGMEVQAPVAVLKFAAPHSNGSWFGPRLPRFEVGDLVGIVPPGADAPRHYSLASASRDGMLEICVRKQSGGLCSEFLHSLVPGETIELRSSGGKPDGLPWRVATSGRSSRLISSRPPVSAARPRVRSCCRAAA